VAGLDAWHLTAAEFLASACRSVLLGLAVLHVRPTLCLHRMWRLVMLHLPLAGVSAKSNRRCTQQLETVALLSLQHRCALALLSLQHRCARQAMRPC
jgi:hypothetical protein